MDLVHHDPGRVVRRGVAVDSKQSVSLNAILGCLAFSDDTSKLMFRRVTDKAEQYLVDLSKTCVMSPLFLSAVNRATRMATYQLLEVFGCRWALGELGLPQDFFEACPMVIHRHFESNAPILELRFRCEL